MVIVGAMLAPMTFTPIGVARTPFPDRVSAPRQPAAARDVEGTIELFPGHDFEHALEDLEGWDRLWVIFAFHLNQDAGWRPKVLPPRSSRRRGVFSTRSPHRPNPIGISVVRLVEVRGLVVRVRDVDLIDGTPVLDLKPYVPYADAFPDARTGWLEPLAVEGSATAAKDPEPGFVVRWSPRAEEQAAWLFAEHGVDLKTPVNRVLELGPQPHPYRRIKVDGDGFRLAVKDWRVRFHVAGREVTVEAILSGYRPSQLAAPATPEIAVQRAFVDRFTPVT
jgi:tRNA-Thr(GGU) m(6)t(6)A37 methyltransferase TsaA